MRIIFACCTQNLCESGTFRSFRTPCSRVSMITARALPLQCTHLQPSRACLPTPFLLTPYPSFYLIQEEESISGRISFTIFKLVVLHPYLQQFWIFSTPSLPLVLVEQSDCTLCPYSVNVGPRKPWYAIRVHHTPLVREVGRIQLEVVAGISDTCDL